MLCIDIDHHHLLLFISLNKKAPGALVFLVCWQDWVCRTKWSNLQEEFASLVYFSREGLSLKPQDVHNLSSRRWRGYLIHIISPWLAFCYWPKLSRDFFFPLRSCKNPILWELGRKSPLRSLGISVMAQSFWLLLSTVSKTNCLVLPASPSLSFLTFYETRKWLL